MTYVEFYCGITFQPEVPTKVGQIDRGRINNSSYFEKLRCIQNNDARYCSMDEEHAFKLFRNLLSL